jgi:hypothetical protein
MRAYYVLSLFSLRELSDSTLYIVIAWFPSVCEAPLTGGSNGNLPVKMANILATGGAKTGCIAVVSGLPDGTVPCFFTSPVLITLLLIISDIILTIIKYTIF